MSDVRIVSPRFIGRMAEAPMRLAGEGWRVIAAEPGPGDETDSVAPIHREVADWVAEAVKAGNRPVAIVGDCCQTIP